MQYYEKYLVDALETVMTLELEDISHAVTNQAKFMAGIPPRRYR